MPRQSEKARWVEVHNRKPGELKDCMSYYEINTPDEVAKILGLSRQRVQQIERSALFKLRRGLRQFWDDYKRIMLL